MTRSNIEEDLENQVKELQSQLFHRDMNHEEIQELFEEVLAYVPKYKHQGLKYELSKCFFGEADYTQLFESMLVPHIALTELRDLYRNKLQELL